MAINAKKYIERALKIRDKEGKIIPLILNAPQRKLYDALDGDTAQHQECGGCPCGGQHGEDL